MADVNSARLVGSVSGVPPTTGSYEPGDIATDRFGGIWICTVGGSPGTWTSDISLASRALPSGPLAPTGAIAENVSRVVNTGGDAQMPASGTPLICPGPWIPGGNTLGHVNLYQSSTAPVGQTHAWVALLDVTGKVLASTTDAGASVWNAGTFVPISLVLSYVAPSPIQTLCAILFAGTTPPSLRGVGANGGFVNAWAPTILGGSTTTGLTGAPAVGSSLGLPTAGTGTSNIPYIFVS